MMIMHPEVEDQFRSGAFAISRRICVAILKALLRSSVMTMWSCCRW